MTCTLLHLVSKYVHELMLMIRDDFTESWVNCDPNKCLNTGILLAALFFGHARAKRVITSCENDKAGGQSRDATLRRVQRFRKRISTPGYSICYVILSDGYFVGRDGNTLYFPGHIFLIERSESDIVIMQSFVDEYSIASSRTKSCRRLDTPDFLFKLLHDLYVSNTWSAETSEAFLRVTGVDASKYEGCSTLESKFDFCMSRNEGDSHRCPREMARIAVRRWREKVRLNKSKLQWVCEDICMGRDKLLRRLGELDRKLRS